MNNHLIPSFTIRESGIKLNNKPKIHVEDPTILDHSVMLTETKTRIPLSLHCIFSYLLTTKQSPQILEDYEEVYVLTSSRWGTHNNTYAHNESHMLDWKGEMVEPKDR